MEQQLPENIMRKAVKGISYIAHPLRLRILEYLDVNGSSSVSAITKALGEEQVIISQSLKKMREANLVRTNRRGIFIYYDICEEYPASIFTCLRKLYAMMTDNFYFLEDGVKAILPSGLYHDDRQPHQALCQLRQNAHSGVLNPLRSPKCYRNRQRHRQRTAQGFTISQTAERRRFCHLAAPGTFCHL